jgi:hypothetical protein
MCANPGFERKFFFSCELFLRTKKPVVKFADR